ncbi:MAG: minor capsid protein [Candidatus Fimivivens sp.]|nr:minor capsid protein [Candidatus Fimivivens sp.]
MQNAEYWRRRAEILEAAKNQSAGSYTAAVEKQFNLAQKKLDEQIEQWYGRFAKNNQITLAEARQWLTGKDLAEFKWDVTEYIKYGKDAMIDPAFMKQLENASARFHVSKLEALKLKTQATVEQLYGQTAKQTTSLFGKIYTDNYYHTAFELQKGVGVGWDVASLNPHQIESVLSNPWTTDKQTFSDRIWKQKNDLLSEVHTQLTQNMILGKAPDDAIKAIAKKFNTSKSNAGRLVMTESAYFATEAQRKAFETLDVEEYEIVATLDSLTSAICQSMDGEHFPMSQFEPGVTAPPFHPWCRSAVAPYFDDDEGERVARDEETGKSYYVPQDMKYKDWKDQFIDGGDKVGLTPVDNGGVISWVKDVPPVPVTPEKKEYLTKKKLQEKITEADGELQTLTQEQMNVSGGYTHDEILQNGGDVDSFFWDNEPGKIKFNELQEQIEQLNINKTDWQELLDKKLTAEKTKALTKQQVTLQAEFDGLENKTYGGIWKDDVSTADWNAKQGSIQAKKDYFTQQLAGASPDDADKWKQLLADLDEFDAQGKHYHEIQSNLKKTQSELISLKKSATIKDTKDPFTQERRDAALWAKDTKEADDLLRQKCGEVWQSATAAQKDAIYDYTGSYSKFNEPLRGYEYGTNAYLGVGNVDLDKIGTNYGGYKPGQVKKQIDAMTAIIEKSSYSSDIWVQRGVEYTGMDKFFNIAPDDFYLSEKELAAKLLGTTPTDYGFFSTGVSKGKGFSHKPIIMNVYAPAGTKMMYAEPFSQYGQGAKRSWDGVSSQYSFGSESEMIFQRGTTFRITKVEKTGGKIYMDIEVIGQEVY